jgi:hypothetical protein
MNQQNPKDAARQHYNHRQFYNPDSLDMANRRKTSKSPSSTKEKRDPTREKRMTGSPISGSSHSSSKCPNSRQSQSPRGLPSPTAPFYAVRFPEGQGYLFLRSILVGAQSDASLVIGEKDGKTYIRKARKDDGKGNFLPNMEIAFAKKLRSSGVVPKVHYINEETVGNNHANSAIFEYCNGRDLETYCKDHATDPNIEILIWHVIAEMVKIIAYLQTGVLIGGAQMEATKKEKKRKRGELEVQRGWEPISHRDYNMGNILLSFPIPKDGGNGTNLPLPTVLLGDFGLAEYTSEAQGAMRANNEFSSFSDHLEKFLLILTPRRGGEFSTTLVDCVKSFKYSTNPASSLKSMVANVLPLAQSKTAKARTSFKRLSIPSRLEPFDNTVSTNRMAGYTRVSQLGQGYEWVKVERKFRKYNVIENLGRIKIQILAEEIVSDAEFVPSDDSDDSDNPDQEFIDDGEDPDHGDQEFLGDGEG